MSDWDDDDDDDCPFQEQENLKQLLRCKIFSCTDSKIDFRVLSPNRNDTHLTFNFCPPNSMQICHLVFLSLKQEQKQNLVVCWWWIKILDKIIQENAANALQVKPLCARFRIANFASHFCSTVCTLSLCTTFMFIIITIILIYSRGPAEWMVLVGLHGVAKANDVDQHDQIKII